MRLCEDCFAAHYIQFLEGMLHCINVCSLQYP